MKLQLKPLVKIEKLNLQQYHKCEKCPKVFVMLSQLQEHISWHDDLFLKHVQSAYVAVERTKIYKCDICTKTFDTNREFMFHKIEHEQKKVLTERHIMRFQSKEDIVKPYKCPDCDYEFAAESSLADHSILHLPFPHICECGIGYYQRKDLKGHIKLVHGLEMKELRLKKTTLPQNTPQEEQVTTDTEPKIEKVIENNTNIGPKLKAELKMKTEPDKMKWKVKMKDKDTKEKPLKFPKIPNPNIDIIQTPDNRFECPKCKKTFALKNNVYIHYRTHTGEQPYQCDLCNKCFSQSGSLKLHRASHNADRIYVCTHCPKAFTTIAYKTRHEITHSAIKPYECPYCGKGFHDMSALTRHKRIHTKDKRYCCPLCPKRFTDISGLNGHKLRHSNKKFSCEICVKKFYTKHALNTHMVSHSYERNFCCDYCKKCFSHKNYLRTHIQIHIKPTKYFKCKRCSKRFPTRNNLRNHIESVHRKYKPKETRIECNDCSEQFKRKSKFLHHYLINHSGIRCDKCFRYFPSTSLFNHHRLKEVVQCDICGEKFYCQSMEKQHYKVHLK